MTKKLGVSTSVIQNVIWEKGETTKRADSLGSMGLVKGMKEKQEE